jgi:hypothetical protein
VLYGESPVELRALTGSAQMMDIVDGDLAVRRRFLTATRRVEGANQKRAPTLESGVARNG